MRLPLGREPLDALTLLSIDPEQFGPELTSEGLCRRVDEPFGSELTAEGLRVSSRVEKLEAERLRRAL
jgi:hypothetical protein